MSGMLRTLLRSSSQLDRNGASDGSPKTASMPSSPSFSDFSMGVGQEEMSNEAAQPQPRVSAEISHESTDRRGMWRRSLDSRFSFGSTGSTDSSSSEQSKWDKGDGNGSGMPIPQEGKSFQNHFMSAAAKYAQVGTAPADSKPVPKTSKMRNENDYYEWCELIRSNSL